MDDLDDLTRDLGLDLYPPPEEEIQDTGPQAAAADRPMAPGETSARPPSGVQGESPAAEGLAPSYGSTETSEFGTAVGGVQGVTFHDTGYGSGEVAGGRVTPEAMPATPDMFGLETSFSFVASEMASDQESVQIAGMRIIIIAVSSRISPT